MWCLEDMNTVEQHEGYGVPEMGSVTSFDTFWTSACNNEGLLKAQVRLLVCCVSLYQTPKRRLCDTIATLLAETILCYSAQPKGRALF